MAKKRTKAAAKKPAPAPKVEPSEERAAFLPGDEKQREENEEIAVSVNANSEFPDFNQEVSLKVAVGKDRRLRVTLGIPPLPPWTEEQMWLMADASPEQKAGRIAEAVRAAADQVAQDAPIKHAMRENEEADAKERFAQRA